MSWALFVFMGINLGVIFTVSWVLVSTELKPLPDRRYGQVFLEAGVIVLPLLNFP